MDARSLLPVFGLSAFAYPIATPWPCILLSTNRRCLPSTKGASAQATRRAPVGRRPTAHLPATRPRGPPCSKVQTEGQSGRAGSDTSAACACTCTCTSRAAKASTSEARKHLHQPSSRCLPWLAVAQQILAGEFGGADRQHDRESHRWPAWYCPTTHPPRLGPVGAGSRNGMNPSPSIRLPHTATRQLAGKARTTITGPR